MSFECVCPRPYPAGSFFASQLSSLLQTNFVRYERIQCASCLGFVFLPIFSCRSCGTLSWPISNEAATFLFCSVCHPTRISPFHLYCLDIQ